MLCSAQGHTTVTLGNRVNKISVEDLQKQKGKRSPGSQGQDKSKCRHQWIFFWPLEGISCFL